MAKDLPKQSITKVTSGETLDQVQPGALNSISDKRSSSALGNINPGSPMDRAYQYVDSVLDNPDRLSGHSTWWGIIIRNDTNPSGPAVMQTIPQASSDSSFRNNPDQRGVIRVWVPELHTHLPDPTAYVQWEDGPGDEERFSEAHKNLLAIAELYPRIYGPIDYLRNGGDALLGTWVEVKFSKDFDEGSLVMPGASVASASQAIPMGQHGTSSARRAFSNPRFTQTCPPCNDVPKIKSPPGKNPPADPAPPDDDSILPSNPEELTKLEIDGVRRTITADDCEWFARVIFGETFGKATRLDAQYMFWALVNRMGWGRKFWQMSIKEYFSTFSQPISPHWSRTGVYCRPGGKYSLKDPCNPDRLRRRDISRNIPVAKLPERVIDLVNEFMEGKIPNPNHHIIDWFAGSMWKDKPYKSIGTPEKRAIKFIEGNAFIAYYTKTGAPLKHRRVRLIPGKTRMVIPPDPVA